MGILGGIVKLLLNSGGQTAPQQRTGQTTVNPFSQKQVFACKYCGMEFSSVRDLIINWCQNHPLGKQGHHHELYEGGKKQQYTCKNCGRTYRTLVDLTRNSCQRNPSGNKCHEPAL